jgi:hypothetical protein
VLNAAKEPPKMGNDLVTELLLLYAFICTFALRKGSNSKQYGKVNQDVTLVCVFWKKRVCYY